MPRSVAQNQLKEMINYQKTGLQWLEVCLNIISNLNQLKHFVVFMQQQSNLLPRL